MIKNDSNRLIVTPYLSLLPEDLYQKLAASCQHPSPISQEDAIKNYGAIFQHTYNKLVFLTKDLIQTLQKLRENPTLIQNIDTKIKERLLQEKILGTENEIFSFHHYIQMDIEIDTRCNYRCEYCPVSTNLHPPNLMLDALYDSLLLKAKEYGIKNIALNHYNEPTLHQKLLAKIEQAVSLGFCINLFTNGSLLNEEKIAKIKNIGNTKIIINLPTLNATKYQQITKSKLLSKVLENIELLIKYQVDTKLVIIATKEEREESIHKILSVYEKMLGKPLMTEPLSRGGMLANDQYCSAIENEGILSGCHSALNQFSVSFDGVAFLCCQDYDKKYVLGDLKIHSIKEVAESEEAIALRKMILGYATSSREFICRKCEWTSSLDPQNLMDFSGSREQYSKISEDLRNNIFNNLYEQFIKSNHLIFI